MQKPEIIASTRNQISLFFARILAHELNNIFTGIDGYAQLVEEEEGYISELINIIKKEGRRGIMLIRLFQEFVHRPPEEKVINLKTEINKLLAFFERAFQKNQIQLKLDIDENLKIKTNWYFLELVFAQLLYQLTNLANLTINISAQALPDHTKLEISLPLPGPELPENYFQPTFQLAEVVSKYLPLQLLATEQEDEKHILSFMFILKTEEKVQIAQAG